MSYNPSNATYIENTMNDKAVEEEKTRVVGGWFCLGLGCLICATPPVLFFWNLFLDSYKGQHLDGTTVGMGTGIYGPVLLIAIGLVLAGWIILMQGKSFLHGLKIISLTAIIIVVLNFIFGLIPKYLTEKNVARLKYSFLSSEHIVKKTNIAFNEIENSSFDALKYKEKASIQHEFYGLILVLSEKYPKDALPLLEQLVIKANRPYIVSNLLRGYIPALNANSAIEAEKYLTTNGKNNKIKREALSSYYFQLGKNSMPFFLHLLKRNAEYVLIDEMLLCMRLHPDKTENTSEFVKAVKGYTERNQLKLNADQIKAIDRNLEILGRRSKLS